MFVVDMEQGRIVPDEELEGSNMPTTTLWTVASRK
jgi:hypothetical protein